MDSDDQDVLLAKIGQLAGKFATRPPVCQLQPLIIPIQAKSIDTRTHKTPINNLKLIITPETTITEVWRASRNRLTTVLIKKDINNQLHGAQPVVATPLVDTPEPGGSFQSIVIERLY